jgi:hypothetical protein
MLNGVLPRVVITSLILTFFVLEVSGRFPPFQAFACMVILWLAWRWLGPQPTQRTVKPLAPDRARLAQRLTRMGLVLWYVMAAFIALMLIATAIERLDKQRHRSPASERSYHR